MKLHKIYLFAALAVAATFTSCSSDDDYEPGKQAGEYNMGFAGEEAQSLNLNDSEFSVVLSRKGTNGTVTVPISVISADGFTVPESVTFNNGDSTAVINVGIPSDMELFTEYTFDIRIPEEYTNPYSQDAYSPEYKTTVVKEDYVTYAEGCNFYDSFYYAEYWTADVEYSSILDVYRVKDLFVTGYPLFFKWDKATGDVTVVDSNGEQPNAWYTGLADSDYPAYYVTPSKSKCYYDSENGYIVFDFWWRVSAGSYGTGYPSYLYIK